MLTHSPRLVLNAELNFLSRTEYQWQGNSADLKIRILAGNGNDGDAGGLEVGQLVLHRLAVPHSNLAEIHGAAAHNDTIGDLTLLASKQLAPSKGDQSEGDQTGGDASTT